MNKYSITNVPAQLREDVHIGSISTFVYADMINKILGNECEFISSWNVVGKFNERNKILGGSDLLTSRINLLNRYGLNLNIDNYFIDNEKITESFVINNISGKINSGEISLQKHKAFYCEKCNLFLGTIEEKRDLCKYCGNILILKETNDLFVNVDESRLYYNIANINFIPINFKNEILNSLEKLPKKFLITKSRDYGISAKIFNEALEGKVIDPKYTISLLPSIFDYLGKPKLKKIVLGQNTVKRYLYYLLTNNIDLGNLDIYVHGMLKVDSKGTIKASNLSNLNLDATNFIDIYGKELLIYLLQKSNLGNDIIVGDISQRISELTSIKSIINHTTSFLTSKIGTGNDSGFTEEEKTIINLFNDYLEIKNDFLFSKSLELYKKIFFQNLKKYRNNVVIGNFSKTGLLIILNKIKMINILFY